MLGSQQLPRADRRRARHRRRARDALDRYGTGLTGSRLLNGTIQLHLELEPEIAELDGHRGRDRLHHRPPGQRRHARARSSRPATPSSPTPATTPRSSTAACSRAPSCARSATTASTSSSARSSGPPATAAASWSSSTASSRWRATSRRCRRSPTSRERYGARLMVDEAHGAGVLGARGAGACELLGVEDRVDLRMGTFSKSLASCGGFIAGPAEVIEYLRIQSRAFLFTASAVPAAVGAALAALRDLPLRRGPGAAARVLDNARFLRDGLSELGFEVVEPSVFRRARSRRARRRDGRRHADRARARRRRLEGRAAVARALRRRRLRQRRAPPGGAAGRRAAAHERHGDARRATLDRALEAFAAVKRAFEAEHGPLPGPGEH